VLRVHWSAQGDTTPGAIQGLEKVRRLSRHARTSCRLRQELDALADLAAAIGAWLADHDCPNRRPRAVAPDGKMLNGASGAPRPARPPLAAMDDITHTILAQRQVDGVPGAVPGLRPRCCPTWTWPVWWSPLTCCSPHPATARIW